jgi:hypothetical protein
MYAWRCVTALPSATRQGSFRGSFGPVPAGAPSRCSTVASCSSMNPLWTLVSLPTVARRSSCPRHPSGAAPARTEERSCACAMPCQAVGPRYRRQPGQCRLAGDSNVYSWPLVDLLRSDGASYQPAGPQDRRRGFFSRASYDTVRPLEGETMNGSWEVACAAPVS